MIARGIEVKLAINHTGQSMVFLNNLAYKDYMVMVLWFYLKRQSAAGPRGRSGDVGRHLTRLAQGHPSWFCCTLAFGSPPFLTPVKNIWGSILIDMNTTTKRPRELKTHLGKQSFIWKFISIKRLFSTNRSLWKWIPGFTASPWTSC